MDTKEIGLQQPPTAESPNASSSINDTSTVTTEKQYGTKYQKFDKSKCSMLHIDSKVNACAIKCYDEQLPYGWDYVQNQIKNYDKECIVQAIRHYKDAYAENGSYWKTALEKPHYHILIKFKNREQRVRVGQLMRELGICFRPGLDEVLWKNHGVETIINFAGYSTYLTHDTDDAIRDGKEPYDLTEVVSNYSFDEIKQIREGYIRCLDASKKVSVTDLEELDKSAFKLGYELKDFSEWYDSLPFNIRSHSKMKTIRESYNRGVDARIRVDKNVLRLCVFIKGEHNTGKTYASLHALEGKRVHTVEGGGTGKFDDLRPDHDAIVISDDVCPNLLNMADNYICKAYKRQNNNPAWCGDYFVVTSNLAFEDWVRDCGIKKDEHIKALKSRFFICEIEKNDGVNALIMKQPSTRGTNQELTKRFEMFKEFQKRYNNSLSTYVPVKIPEEPKEQSCVAETITIRLEEFDRLNNISKEVEKTQHEHEERKPYVPPVIGLGPDRQY